MVIFSICILVIWIIVLQNKLSELSQTVKQLKKHFDNYTINTTVNKTEKVQTHTVVEKPEIKNDFEVPLPSVNNSIEAKAENPAEVSVTKGIEPTGFLDNGFDFQKIFLH